MGSEIFLQKYNLLGDKKFKIIWLDNNLKKKK